MAIKMEDICYIHYANELASKVIAHGLTQRIRMHYKKGPVVVYCIGSDRYTGDSLGPLVGHMLNERYQLPYRVDVIGTLDKPIDAFNLKETLKKCAIKYTEEPLYIPVDSFICNRDDHEGLILVRDGALKPGKGVGNKGLPCVGLFRLVAAVAVRPLSSTINPVDIISTAKLGVVYKMAEVIAEGISLGLKWGLC